MIACIHCGSQYGGGYCWRSPDGECQLEDVEPDYSGLSEDEIVAEMKSLEAELNAIQEDHPDGVMGSDVWGDMQRTQRELDDLNDELIARCEVARREEG